MPSRKMKQAIYFFSLLVLHLKVLGQVPISGPICVLPGLEYQYHISGNLSTMTTTEWCIVGGTLLATDSSCTADSLRLIRVKWNDVGSGSITFRASGHNVITNVNIAKVLNAGHIDSASRLQDAKKNQPPASITCSQPSGGNCLPNYTFQWQESSDGMEWSDISGAIFPHLQFSAKPKTTMYYRRKVIETKSNSVGLSNTALVLIKPLK